MKKIIFLFLIVHCTLIIANAQSTWFWQNPMPASSEINKAFFLNANTGWVPSIYGRISKTTNGGLNWINQYLQSNINIAEVFFVDANIGWAVGSSGLVIKSTDGGTTWVQQINNLNGNLSCVMFIDALTGFIGGAYFLKTTNGGTNWIISNIIEDAMSSLYFINSQTGWIACSNSHIQKTTNGGISFQTTISPSFYNYDVFFNNENTGWVAGEIGLYKTTDAGNNWTTCVVPNYYSGFSSLYFKDVNTGWITGGNKIFNTTNGGMNWSIPIYAGGFYLNFLYFSDINTGYVGGGTPETGTNPSMSKTTNGGLNWINLVTNQSYFNSISIVNSNYAFIAGLNDVLKTTNGGNEWIYNLNTNESFFTTFFVNAQTGWIAGYHKLILRTTNAGTNWNKQDSSSYNTFYNEYNELYFLNLYTGWVVGDRIIKKTTNSGTNWEKLSGYDTNKTYYSVQFLDENTGWVSFDGGYTFDGILKTSDGGSNWVTQYNSTNGGVKSLQIINQYTGYAIGYFNGILKTTNSGNNWYLVNDSLTGIKSIYFIDANRGWLVGHINYQYGNGMSYILKTTDGGISWESIPTVTDWTLTCVKFADANTGWIVGYNGVILKTTSGGLTFTSKINSDMPKNYLLFQNYPNPFNPTTNIHYEIPRNGFVKLVVYDILGREVQTLVNEKQNAGTYEVTFNARQPGLGSNLPSGIYFYTLSVGEYKETKKFVLLK